MPQRLSLLARAGFVAIALSVCSAGAAVASPVVKVAFSEVRIGLDYYIGIADAESERSAFRSAYGDDQAGLTLEGFIAREWPIPPEVRHYQEVSAFLVGTGSLAYVDNTIDTPSFYGHATVTGELTQIGDHAGGLLTAPASDNYIYYEFDVVGEAVNYTLSFNEDNLNGSGIVQIRSEATGLPIINLGETSDRMGTLQPGTYYLTASHSISTTSSETSTISVAMAFPGATLTPYIPEPTTLALLATATPLVLTRRRGI